MSFSGANGLSTATHVQECLTGFHNVCNSLAKAEPQIRLKLPPHTIHDSLGRFQLWVGNIGAHHRGRSSLDYKLREASHISDRVIELLENLKSILREASEIITGERVPWEDLSDSDSDLEASDSKSQMSEGGTTTELAQLASNLTEINGCLMRLSTAIRNPAPHDQFRESADIDVTHFETFDVEHVRGKFPLAKEFLIRRLGEAISRRRQYLRYREEHRKRLGHGLKPSPPLSQELTALAEVSYPATAPSEKIESTVASSLPAAAKFSTSVIELDEHDYYEDTLSQTSYASSTTDMTKLRPLLYLKRVKMENHLNAPYVFASHLSDKPLRGPNTFIGTFSHTYVRSMNANYPIARTNRDMNGFNTSCKHIVNGGSV
ncbi:hypothetical protein GQ44DRAFT_774719 [Phaeosphaeriaceae sp. PMI808]|nr:hypothetical protein GQ44DRAFT_774719 [Phaeosphaeriaceae sp. PMI808]